MPRIGSSFCIDSPNIISSFHKGGLTKTCVHSSQLSNLSSDEPDNFIRVKGRSYCRPWTRSVTPPPETHARERYVFGETDYLRNKLGLCMPTVKGTLTTESLQTYKGIDVHGFQDKQRRRLFQNLDNLDLVYKRVLSKLEKTRSSLESHNISQSKSVRLKKRGMYESEHYIVVLDASTRRSRQIEQKAKFAVSKGICNTQRQSMKIETASKHDHKLLTATKSQIKMDKERLLKKSQRKRKSVKPMTPKRSRSESEFSDQSSMSQTSSFGKNK